MLIVKNILRNMKFKKGDKVYLDKRGIMKHETVDWTLVENGNRGILYKNRIYIVDIDGYIHNESIRITIDGYTFGYSEEHFKLYEQI